jgi:thiol:disulfide interchange protein
MMDVRSMNRWKWALWTPILLAAVANLAAAGEQTVGNVSEFAPPSRDQQALLIDHVDRPYVRPAGLRNLEQLLVAQENAPPTSEPKPKLNIAEALGLGGEKAGEEAERVAFSAEFKLLENSRQGTLSLTAKIDPGWHVYSVTQQKGGPMASKIKVAESADFKVLGPFVPDQHPHIKTLEIYKVPVEEHEGQVTWSAPIEIAEGVKPESLTIEVIYSGQVCSDVCIPLFNRKVEAKFAGFTTTPAPQAPTRGAPAPAPAAAAPKPIDAYSLMVAAAIGFLGGMILNFMPCVLPVIGLKILSFAQQGGQRRGRIFALNLWFFFGIMAVFLALATLAAVVNLFWGEQFTYTWFKVALILVTFAMALSFLGVWEIPIPGFSQSAGNPDAAAEEGLGGAFFKGMFTTLLATPCSGPLLGPLFTFVAGSSPIVAYVLFGSIGLGMGLPYLVIGAFPRLVYWLPKPGAWMETFKQLMGFVLLFTLVYLFWSVPSYYVPTLATVIGVWLACWWIGRVPVYEEMSKQVWAWIGGVAVAALVGVLAFSIFGPKSDAEKGASIAWQPFSQQQLSREITAGKTVMIDFTANWCPTCQLNTYYAIETPKVKELLEKNGVVPMLADWTEHSPEIKAKLQELNSASIPFLAIYPAGRPEEVIRLQDVISESQLLEALQKAGPSKTAAAASVAETMPAGALAVGEN